MKSLSRITAHMPAMVCLLWVGVSLLFLMPFMGLEQEARERVASLLVFPVLLGAFQHGRAGGLLIAFVASMVWGSFILGERLDLNAPLTQHVFFNIALVNVLALVTSWLSEREKSAVARYRHLFQDMPVGIYQATPEGQVFEANDRFHAILGRDPQTNDKALNIADLLVDPEEFRTWSGSWAAMKAPDAVHEFEVQVRREDGSVIWARNTMHLAPHPDGVGLCLEGVILDVTEAREARIQVEEAHLLTRSILESLPDATFVVDANKRVLAWNRAIEEMSGTPKEDILGKGDHAYSFPFYGENRPVLVDLVWEDDEVVRSRYDFVEKHGHTLFAEVFVPSLNNGAGAYVWAMATPLFDKQGRIAGAIESIRDITKIKAQQRELELLNTELEQIVEQRTHDLIQQANELEVANARLRELDEMKTAFLNTVSHDIRTPLTSILGYAKIIAKDFQRNFRPLVEDEKTIKRADRVQTNLRVIVSEGQRLTRLLNDFLDLARIESGKMKWHDRHVDVGLCVHKAATAVSGLFEDNPDLLLEVAVEEGLPAIYIDPDRLEQVILNLLTNAVKFTDRGRVSVSARLAHGARLELRVTDTGVGISQKDQAEIFDKFHQADTADTLRERPKGTGLGLAICKEIVEYYQGSIRVESTPGQGSSFIVELPVDEAPEN